MTECHTKKLDFTRLGRRQVVADFLGGRLTTDAGALLLREVDRRIGLIDAINDCIPDPLSSRESDHASNTCSAFRFVRKAVPRFARDPARSDYARLRCDGRSD